MSRHHKALKSWETVLLTLLTNVGRILGALAGRPGLGTPGWDPWLGPLAESPENSNMLNRRPIGQAHRNQEEASFTLPMWAALRR